MNKSKAKFSCCSSLLSTKIKPEEAVVLAAIFKVLGDATRLQLLSLIASRPEHEACVCELTEPLGLSQPTISHHLKVLYEAGLVSKERRGSWIYYQLVPERIEALRNVLAIS
ncbi:MAG: metalloregulator ArsR/SmtB family transcription factor [Cyanobacteria bacterium J06621_15]